MSDNHKSYDQVIFTWGKFKGTTLGNVLRTNPQYLKWVCSSDILPDEWVEAAKRALVGEDISDLKLPRVKTSNIQKPHSTKSPEGDIFVYLVDKKTAYIKMPYDKALIEQFKYEIDGRTWNKDDGRWEFPVVHLPKVQKVFPAAKFSDDAQELLNKLIDRRAKLDELREIEDIDLTIKGFKVTPYNYQRTGIQFVTSAGGRALIADAPGLGKTLMSVAYAQLHNRKTLIVCPLSVVINWKREILTFTGKHATIWDSQGYDGKLSAQFHICHYDAVPKMCQYLKNENFDLLVCDEATYLKNRKTIRAKSIFGSYAERRKYPGIKTKDVILLTGTPIMSRPVELFTLLNFLDKDRFNNFFHFVQRYGGWRGQPPQNLQELHDRIKDLVIRRKKENVLTDLPKKQRNELYVELSATERKEYNKLLKELFGQWGSYGRPSVRHMPKLQSFLIDKKLPRLIEMVDEYLDNGKSILVFSNYLAPLRKLQEHYGDKVAMITGEMDRHTRQNSIDNLISKKAQIGAFSLKAAGMGINGLQEVIDTVVFLDFDWIVATHEQAEDRCHRIGQVNSVQSFYMICADTIDEVMRDVLREKQELADQVVDGEIALDTTNKSMFKEFVKRISFMFDGELDTETIEE